MALVGSECSSFDHGRQQMELLADLEVTAKAVERVSGGKAAGITRSCQMAMALRPGQSQPRRCSSTKRRMEAAPISTASALARTKPGMLDGTAVGMNCSLPITAAFQGRRVQVNHAGDLNQRRLGGRMCCTHVLSFETGSPLENMIGLCAVRVRLRECEPQLRQASGRGRHPQTAHNHRPHIIAVMCTCT